ncbi:MAG: hypothetical protein LBF95_06540 [Treponema sp.]|nr:hypothetical protein [Treponema sp.]
MNFLLDTNVVSELWNVNCHWGVRKFADNYDWETFFMSAVSIGEISYGVERLPPEKKKTELIYYAVIIQTVSSSLIRALTSTLSTSSSGRGGSR